jgi:hypothetical protein
MRERRSASLLAVLVATSALAPGLANAVGVTVAKVAVVRLHAGVIAQGETDAFPDDLTYPLWGCIFPAVGRSQLYLVAADAQPGDEIVLWTYEQDELGQVVHVAHPATGAVPHASARTYAWNFGCPNFEVEGRIVGGPGRVAYAVLSCDLVGTCPAHIPIP